MTDDLSAVWRSDQPTNAETIMAAVEAVLEEDRATRAKERFVRRSSVLAVGVLCPVLVWCAAFGKTPLVRGGFALMAVGAALMVLAEWMYVTWSREALPGPVDSRSQLQKTGFLLSRQAHLLRTAPLWCAPIFVGTALIGLWTYQERTHAAAYWLWAFIGAAWFLSWVTGHWQGARLRDRRARVERLLSDLG
jgi:hypothetical protein